MMNCENPKANPYPAGGLPQLPYRRLPQLRKEFGQNKNPPPPLHPIAQRPQMCKECATGRQEEGGGWTNLSKLREGIP